jgi:very-short-patch-repair endonuclease
VTQAQILDAGWSRAAWYRALDDGRLVPVAPLVAALPGAPPTVEQLILAAVLVAGAPAMASHRSAAYLWGVDVMPVDPVDITTPVRTRGVSPPWIRLHTPTDLDDLRPVRRHGIPATNPLRVLLDLGQVAPDAVLPALQHFMVEGVVSAKAVVGALVRHARQGRHGVGALRAAVDAWAINGVPPDSELERVMAALLRRHGLPPAVFHARVLGFEVDFAYVAEKLILECDGWAIHGLDKEAFERDRARDAALVAAGWTILHLSWAQITQRPMWVADVIRSSLAERGLRDP